MAEDLDKKLADEKAAASKVQKTPEELKAEETKKAEEHLANIKKAIAEANDELKKKRAAAKDDGKGAADEDLPKIDDTDPSTKAWDKRFGDRVDPLKRELDQEKEEIRTFALREFLKDKPNLAKDVEALKRVMQTYDKIKTSSERTKEGVLNDLDRAYAAEYHQDILQNRREGRIAEAQGDAIFSDPAVSRGDNSFRKEREDVPHLDKEDELILAKWGLTPSQWVEMDKKQKKKTT